MTEYASALAALHPVLVDARERGFLGPEPIENHLHHVNRYCLPALVAAERCLDLGTGGGIPGLALALLYPKTAWVLLDAMQKRCAFLAGAIDRLSLGHRVVVAEGRAEELGRSELRRSFDVVTVRSFGPPAVVAECAAPFLRLGGHVLVSEPPEPGDRWPTSGLQQLGLRRTSWDGSDVADLEQFEVCPDAYPRRTGLPRKRPLF